VFALMFLVCGCGPDSNAKSNIVVATRTFYSLVSRGDLERASEFLCADLQESFLADSEFASFVRSFDEVRVLERSTGAQMGQKSVHLEFSKNGQTIQYYFDVEPNDKGNWVLCPIAVEDLAPSP
jgi:hypothetical protein